MVWSLLAAAGSAVAYGVSTLMQAVATRRARGLAVVVQPLVIGAFVLDGAGFLLALAALDRLPLFVVQSVMASMVVVVVVGATVVLKVAMRGVDAIAVGVVVLALVVIGMSSGEQPAVAPPPGFTTAMLVAVGVLAVAALALARRGPGWLAATVAALGFSAAAIGARAAHHAEGLWATLWQPMTAAIVVGGVVGALTYLVALGRSSVGAAASVLAVLEVVVPGAVGVRVLGDSVRPGWSVAAGVALLAALAGCVVLATSPSNAATEGREVEAGAAATGSRPG